MGNTCSKALKALTALSILAESGNAHSILVGNTFSGCHWLCCGIRQLVAETLVRKISTFLVLSPKIVGCVYVPDLTNVLSANYMD